MQEPTILRTTKIGGGYVKEDVMQYLDELNSKIVSLEDELKKAQETGPADPQEIVKYRNQVDNLQEKLNASNNALRSAKAELDAAKKQHEEDQKLINQLKAGGAKAAPAGVAPAANSAELTAAKNEIERLRKLLSVNEQKLAEAQKKVAAAPTAAPNAAPVADTTAKDAEIAKIKAEIDKITGELTAKSSELAAKTRESAEKDNKITQLSKEVQDKAADIARKDAEITKLNNEISDLKENAESSGLIPSSLDMGALFTEAQKTANKITIEARHAADKVTKEANEEAVKIVNGANAEAAKTIESANTTAAACIQEANDQAKETVKQANLHAEKVNQMSETVRKTLLNEIESVNSKFNDISSLLSRMSTQATERMSEAQLVIGEARKAVDSGAGEVKISNAPSASFEAKKAPQAAAPSVNSSPSAASSYQSAMKNSQPVHQAQPQAAPKPAYNQSHLQENKSPKKAASFNFDMSELLKAAEEEAAKESANPEE